MVKVEKHVVYIKDGAKHRLYKTRRAPTKYYYRSGNNKRVYVDSKEIESQCLDVYITY